MTKNFKHAANEYGYEIQVTSSSYLLINCITGIKSEIIDKETLRYLSSLDQELIINDYDIAVKVMRLLHIRPRTTLKQYLYEVGKSPTQFANEIGLHKNNIIDITKGKADIRKIQLINAIKIANGLNISVEDLVMFSPTTPYEVE